jgi:hypothetical protein
VCSSSYISEILNRRVLNDLSRRSEHLRHRIHLDAHTLHVEEAVGTSSEHSASSACPQPRRPASAQRPSLQSIPFPNLKHCLELYTALTGMARLDHAITALDLLGSVVQAVPVVGENLKSATDIAKKLCEMVQVRTPYRRPYMRLTCHAEDEGKSRGVRATRGSRG